MLVSLGNWRVFTCFNLTHSVNVTGVSCGGCSKTRNRMQNGTETERYFGAWHVAFCYLFLQKCVNGIVRTKIQCLHYLMYMYCTVCTTDYSCMEMLSVDTKLTLLQFPLCVCHIENSQINAPYNSYYIRTENIFDYISEQ